MQNISSKLSPLSWAIFIVAFLPLFLSLFRPSFEEFAVFLFVDTLALMLLISAEKRFLSKWFPQLSVFDVELWETSLDKISEREKIEFYKEACEFPTKFARYCILSSIIKVLPGSLIILFYWSYSSSIEVQLLRIIVIELVLCTYFYGAVYIESHIILSQKLQQYHAIGNWSNAFKSVRISEIRSDYKLHENFVLVSLWLFLLIVQWVLVNTYDSDHKSLLAFQIAASGLSGLVLFSRIWFLGRTFYLGALESLFSTIRAFNPKKPSSTLALHTSPILAQFEMSFNSMIHRIHAYEQELSGWILARSEQSRFQAIGEISSLIVHDLSAPIHVVRFCTEQLKEDPNRIQNGRYLEQLRLSGQRSEQLIESLRSYLRNPKSKSTAVTFSAAHVQVMRLLETQFYSKEFSSQWFSVNRDVLKIEVEITCADLIHVLLNLYSNSVRNFIENANPSPKILVSLQPSDGGFYNIYISDNGTGLSYEEYEFLTSFVNAQLSQKNPRHGLGLRLVRRLVEQHGGYLNVVKRDSAESGTTFSLKLRKKDSRAESFSRSHRAKGGADETGSQYLDN